MKKVILLIASASVLSGCLLPTAEGYRILVDSWQGASEQRLISTWGVPSATYTANGTKFIAYRSNRNVYIPGTAPSYTTNVIGNTAYTNSYGGTSAQNIAMSCETTFAIVRGEVAQATFRGNDCTALPPEAP
jgi:hypothetical protein